MAGLEQLTYGGCTRWGPGFLNNAEVKVLRVIDGDTICVGFYSTQQPTKVSVRIRGIDTPELTSNNTEEQALAEAARDRLNAFLGNAIVTLEDVGTEKYGRVLATVLKDGESAADYMLQPVEIAEGFLAALATLYTETTQSPLQFV